MTRTPYPFPSLRLAPEARLFELEAEHVALEGYRAHPLIRAPIAV
jgi:thymidylate synthase